MITDEEFEEFVTNDLVYAQRMLSVIDDFGKQITLNNLAELHSNYGKTIKLECMEKFNDKIYNYCNYLKKVYNHNGPVTCHLFKSYKNSKSFDLHFDPDDVFIYVISGSKTFEFDTNQTVTLKAKESLYIPSGKKHKALNIEESMILSFGLEKFLIDKL
jgi:mannose-6-phosphate isomerase-like protein (cupin superfamily)